VVVDARQWVLEFDGGAGGVSQLLRIVLGIVADQFGERGELLVSDARQVETVAVVDDSYVRHRVASPAHNNSFIHYTNIIIVSLA